MHVAIESSSVQGGSGRGAVDDAVPQPRSLEEVQAWSARTLDASIRRSLRSSGIANRDLAIMIGQLDRSREYQLFGYPSAVQYAFKRLQLGLSVAKSLVRVGRALLELRRVDESFVRGRITWSKVRQLASIATVDTEGEWVEAAESMDWREFERAVKTSRRGKGPRPDGKGLREIRLEVRGLVDPLTHEFWERVREKLAVEGGEPLTFAQALRAAASLVLGTRPDGSVEGRHRVAHATVQVVVHAYPVAGVAKLQTRDGLVPLDANAVEQLRKHADEIVIRKEDLERDAGPRDENGLAPKTPEWMRQFVLARDGHRCRHCGSEESLQVHHIAWRSEGGETTLQNLICLCDATHALVHAGLLRVELDQDGSVRFTSAQEEPVPGEPAPDVDRDAPEANDEDSSEIPRTPWKPRADKDAHGAVDGATFRDVPDEASPEWWRAHLQQLRWNDRRSLFEFRSETPLDPPAAPAPRGRAGHPGRGRPQSLDEIVGQPRAVAALRQAAAAARIAGEPASHVLLLGAAGYGKTSLALAYGLAAGSFTHVLSAPMFGDLGALVGHLGSVSKGDVVFIDEIHALPKRIAEALYQAVENRTLSVTVTDGFRTKAVQLRLEPFTLVAATTQPDEVPAPLLARLALRETLEPYAIPELATILERAASRLGIPVSAEAAHVMARAGRETPREALMLLIRVRNAAIVAGTPVIDGALVRRTLDEAGIDADGMTAIDRKVLSVLREHGSGHAIGVVRLAAMAGTNVRTLKALHEPFLVRRGLIATTPWGRIALPAGGEEGRRRMADCAP